MPSIASLTVDLIAESSQFRKELGKASKASDGWAKQVRSSANVAAKSIAAVGVAAAAGLAAMYTATAQSIDQQAKFADKIGISTEALAGLQYAGELTGVSANTLNMGLQRMTRRVAEAANGTGEAVQALDQLGLSAQQLNQMSPDEQFKAIAAAMGDVEGRSEQVRLAFKLFDSEGVALLNTLDAGVDGLAAMQGEAEMLGIAMSRVDAAKIEQANDAFYKVGLTGKGVAQSFTAELAPIVQGLSQAFVDAAVDAGGFAQISGKAIDFVVEGIGRIADRIYHISIPISAIKAGFLELAAVAAESMSDSAETVAKVLNKTLGELGRGIKFLLDELAGLVNKASTIPGEIGKIAKDMSKTIAEMGASVSKGLTFDTSDVRDGIDDIRQSADKAKKDLVALYNQPLPSEQIKAYVKQWNDLATAQATAAANAKQYNSAVIPLPGVEGEGTNTGFSDKEKEKLAAELQRMEESFLSQTQLIELQETQKLAQVEQFREADLISFQKYESLKKQVKIKSDQDIAKLEARQRSMQLQNSAQLFDGMAGLAETFAGEQSGIYKVMFAASKAFAIADSIMKIQQGIANAAAIPFPANIGAMATVAAQTASIVSTISGTNMEGMAHDGIDSIPKEGTWLLDKGERVVDSRTNQDLKQYLSQQSQSANGNINWTIIVNEAPPGTEVNVDEQRKTVEIAVAQTKNDIYDDFTRRGPLRRSLGV